MSKTCWFALALAGLASVAPLRADEFAHAVVAYNPGSNYAVNFTNPNTALGRPSRVNPFGEATDPFNPPYGTNQIVSLGEGELVRAKRSDRSEAREGQRKPTCLAHELIFLCACKRELLARDQRRSRKKKTFRLRQSGD